MRIDFSIPERYSSRVAPGDTISFRVQGVEETFSGVIHAVEPEIVVGRARAVDDENGAARLAEASGLCVVLAAAACSVPVVESPLV